MYDSVDCYVCHVDRVGGAGIIARHWVHCCMLYSCWLNCDKCTGTGAMCTLLYDSVHSVLYVMLIELVVLA